MQDAGDKSFPVAHARRYDVSGPRLWMQGVSGAIPLLCPSKAYPALAFLEIGLQKVNASVLSQIEIPIAFAEQEIISTQPSFFNWFTNMLPKVLLVCLLDFVAIKAALGWTHASRVELESSINTEKLVLVAFVAVSPFPSLLQT